MSIFAKRLAYAAIIAGLAAPAMAADMVDPAPYEPAPQTVETPDYNGWYIRGDAGYRWSQLRGVDYTVYNYDGCLAVGFCEPGTKSFDEAKLKGGFSLGGGVGYQISNHFRTDLTADYWFKTKMRGHTTDTFNGLVSTDTSSFNAFVLLANAYADLGTWNGFTPYVGAGIGGAHVNWGALTNDIPGTPPNIHEGAKGWRFAWALSAGASYCLTEKLALDGGYRFTRVEGGKMFGERDANGTFLAGGPGYDRGMNVHEVRAGLRYSFGGNRNCATPQAVAYEPLPEPQPVYK